MATKEHCVYCFDAIVSHFEKKKAPEPTFSNDKYPLFVTLLKDNPKYKEPVLRGCKGTFEAKDLHSGLSDFALISALKDRRFSPLTHNEIQHLTCGVSLLFNFEPGNGVWDWEVGKHGIIIDFVDTAGSERSATYLPEVAIEQEWTKEEAIESLIQKTGWHGSVSEQLLQSIKLTRYQSSKVHIHYKEYLELKKK